MFSGKENKSVAAVPGRLLRESQRKVKMKLYPPEKTNPHRSLNKEAAGIYCKYSPVKTCLGISCGKVNGGQKKIISPQRKRISQAEQFYCLEQNGKRTRKHLWRLSQRAENNTCINIKRENLLMDQNDRRTLSTQTRTRKTQRGI